MFLFPENEKFEKYISQNLRNSKKFKKIKNFEKSEIEMFKKIAKINLFLFNLLSLNVIYLLKNYALKRADG